jgi:hypothetical protein
MREAIREVETPTGQQLNVYAQRKGALFWACYTLVFLVGFTLLGVWVGHSAPLAIRFIVGAIGFVILALFMGWSALYYGYWALTTQPLLAINSDGIVDNGSVVGFGLIRWHEIRDIGVYKSTQGGTVYFCVIPNDKDALIARLPFLRKLMYYTLWWSIRGPSPMIIPQAILPVPARELVNRISSWGKG